MLFFWSVRAEQSNTSQLLRYLSSLPPALPLPPKHGRAQADLTPKNRKPAVMTFVVTENCIKCKYTDCVEVCPVDCFHEGPNFLVIDPEECIDCTLCEPECPVQAIYPEEDLPADQHQFLEINRELALEWPVITEMKPAPDDAAEWEDVPGKIKYLKR